jgi:hypothetical protein
MKPLFFSALFFLCTNICSAQVWSVIELEKANTAKNIKGITQEEKEVIRYINLARLYPKKFASIELKKAIAEELYKETEYTRSLQQTLNNMKPVNALTFDQGMYQLANCFAIESGKSGSYGHHRVNCVDGFDGECCSYDCQTGLTVTLQLLIDQDVPSLGHRGICLYDEFSKVGVSIKPHSYYNYCCVLDFKRND